MAEAPNPFASSDVDPGKPTIDEDDPMYTALRVRALQTRSVLLLLVVAYPAIGAFSYFAGGSLVPLISTVILGAIYFGLRAILERAPFGAPLAASILFLFQLLAALLTGNITALVAIGTIFALLVRGTLIGWRIRGFRTRSH